MRFPLRVFTLSFVVFLGSWTLVAAPLPPVVSARYEVIAKGVAVADYHLRLDYPESGRFRAAAELKPKGMFTLFNKTTVRETSSGMTQGGRFLPSRYTREKSRSKDDRTDVTVFRRDESKVTMTFRKKHSVHDVPEGSLDSLSFYLELMSDAVNNRIQPTYTLADRGRVKTYTLTDEGEPIMETGLGRLNLRKLVQRSPGDNRYTVFGLSPRHGYAPMLIARYKGGDLDTKIVIVGLSP